MLQRSFADFLRARRTTSDRGDSMEHMPKILRLWIAVSRPLALAALALSIPVCALSQVVPNNSYAQMLQNNAIRQSNLTQQMINLGGKPTSGSGGSVCLPPFDLQRGPAGIVPPALQGDPRYQDYLRCRYGNVPITPAMANAPALPVSPGSGGSPPAQQASWNTQGGVTAAPRLPAPQSGSAAPAQHLPIAATDFVPVQQGHPVVDQSIANMPLSPLDRMKIYNNVNSTFTHVATTYRANNLAVSMAVAYSAAYTTLNGTRMNAQQTRELAFGVNDNLAQGQFALMSDVDKQNSSDLWIFETTLIWTLRDLGQHGDAQSAQAAVDLSRTVLQRLTGS
jgi:hypothetical protein